MAWNEVKPESVADLFGILFDLGTPTFLCRGQSRMDEGWEHLTTSLNRAVADRQVASPSTRPGYPPHQYTGLLEIFLVDQFHQRAHMHLSATEHTVLKTIVGHLSLMQHYGAPTRLLDWTMSPWIAAYFAAVEHPSHDGVIWVVENNTLVLKSSEAFGSQLDRINKTHDLEQWATIIREPFDGVSVVTTSLHNSRMTAQQSLHTIAGTFADPHDVLIEKIVESEKRKKIIVNANLKGKLIRRLDRMNVNRYSLFGGAEGVGRMLSDLAKSGDSILVMQPVRDIFLGSESQSQ